MIVGSGNDVAVLALNFIDEIARSRAVADPRGGELDFERLDLSRQSPNDIKLMRNVRKSPPLRGGSAIARRAAPLIPRGETLIERQLQATPRHPIPRIFVPF